MRYAYWVNIKTFDAAQAALEDAYADGDILAGEKPDIEAYRVTAPNGGYVTRYRITLEG